LSKVGPANACSRLGEVLADDVVLPPTVLDFAPAEENRSNGDEKFSAALPAHSDHFAATAAAPASSSMSGLAPAMISDVANHLSCLLMRPLQTLQFTPISRINRPPGHSLFRNCLTLWRRYGVLARSTS